VSVKDLVKYGGALTGAPFAVPSVIKCWRPPKAAGKDLQRLHAAATRMAQIYPQPLVDAEAAHGLEQQSIHSVVECLSAGPVGESTAAARRHQNLMVGFERLLQTQPDRNVRMTELCAALGASPTGCCAAYARSIWGWAQPAKAASAERRWRGAPCGTEARVSEVARGCGFADPSRFAVDYRALFGELPSATLRRASVRGIVGFAQRRSREPA
jgi:hypothetical protein